MRNQGFAVCAFGMLAGTTLASEPGAGLIVLDPSASGALGMSGQAHVQVMPHAIYVNSTSSSAVSASGNALIETSRLYLCGQTSFSGNASCTGDIVRSNTPFADPLANIPIPNGNGMANHGNKSINAGNVTLQPGRYGSLSLSSHPTVTFAPGTYVLTGSLSISGQPTIIGNGVTIVLLSGGVSMSGQAALTLTPQTTGPLAGIVICQPTTNTSTVSLSGGSTISISGTIYTPRSTLNLSGQGAVQGEGPQMGDLVIARRVSMSGQGVIKIGRVGMTTIELPSMPLFD